MSTDNDTLSNNSVKVIVPTDLNDIPITDEKNPAYLGGAIHETMLFCERTGYFQNLYTNGIVLRGHRTIVDSDHSVSLVTGEAPDVGLVYSFNVPCPVDPATRIKHYDTLAEKLTREGACSWRWRWLTCAALRDLAGEYQCLRVTCQEQEGVLSAR